MKKSKDTEIYFRARRIVDEIVKNEKHDLFNELAKNNKRTGELIDTLASEEQARIHYGRAAARDPQKDGLQMSAKLIAQQRMQRRRRVVSIAAAACVLTFGVLAFAFRDSLFNSRPIDSFDDYIAGNNKTTLTLDNGEVVSLDDADEVIYRQGTSAQAKAKGGELSYSAAEDFSDPVMNSVRVPRGGEHKVTLSDGTRIWLNSDSYLRYSVPFAGDERVVYLEGEAYFEVIGDRQRPFIVESAGHSVEVFGTKFNVSAHKSDRVIHTTLVEGEVSVTTQAGVKLLSPGQQAMYDVDRNTMTVAEIDIDDFISWKDGFINIEKNSLEQVLAKLSRWYGVDFVIVDESIKKIVFDGDILRSNPLSSVMNLLSEASDIKFKVKDNIIEVRAK